MRRERVQAGAGREAAEHEVKAHLGVGGGKASGDGRQEPVAEGARQVAIERGQPIRPVDHVAAEDLVAAVAAHDDLHVARRLARDNPGADGRRVREGLVEGVRQIVDDRARVRDGDGLVVARPAVRGHAPRPRQLVVTRVLPAEADGERPHPLARQPTHQRDDQAGVEPAAQEGADGHVADHRRLDGVLQMIADQAAKCVGLRRQGLALIGALFRKVPIALQRQPPRSHRRTRVPGQCMAGLKLADAFEHRPRAGHVVKRQVVVERLAIQRAPDAGG